MKLKKEEIAVLKDPNWRLDNLYKIKDKNQRIIKFKKNNIQQILHENSTRFDDILKSRQVGISTYYLLKKLDKTIFTPNYTACILSHKRESMEKLFAIIRRAHKHLHPMIQPRLDKGGGSKYEMRFPEIDSKIYCTMEAVSDTVNDLHVSEMALMENDDRVFTSMDAVPLDSGIISIETTARGFNHYHKFRIEKETIFKRHFFPWYFHEEYAIQSDVNIIYTDEEKRLIKKAKNLYGYDITKENILYRRAKIKQRKDKKIFLREYPEDDKSCFMGTGDSPFDLENISVLINNLEDPIHSTETLKIYKEFDASKTYVCGADTSEGKGGDFSVATIYEVNTMEQVAQIRSNKWRPKEFADEIYKLCEMYHKPSRVWPLLAVELNNHGHACILQLEYYLKYPNLYEYKKGEKGWLTNSISRPIMINAFIDGIEDDNIKVNSYETLSECLTLVNNKGKIEAEVGEHDDTIIASAIALQMCIEKKSDLSLYEDIHNKILL